MTINERIAEVVKSSGLTKSAFAKRINISQPSLSQIIGKITNPSNQTVAAICREFDVSEDWLRTGEGEMFIQLTPDEERLKFLAELVKGETDPEVLAFVDALGKAPRDQLKTIMEFVLSVAEEYKKNNPDA